MAYRGVDLGLFAKIVAQALAMPFVIGPFVIGPFVIGPFVIGPFVIGPFVIGLMLDSQTGRH